MARTWCCPFWKWEEGCRVYCEGARLHFLNAVDREDYIGRYCADNPGWESCTVAQHLCRQYEKSCAAV